MWRMGYLETGHGIGKNRCRPYQKIDIYNRVRAEKCSERLRQFNQEEFELGDNAYLDIDTQQIRYSSCAIPMTDEFSGAQSTL